MNWIWVESKQEKPHATIFVVFRTVNSILNDMLVAVMMIRHDDTKQEYYYNEIRLTNRNTN